MLEIYPLAQMTLEEAIQRQFALVEQIHRYFTGMEFLQAGDYGLVPPAERPGYTQRVEKVLAAFFGAEDSVLVRGAGTGALYHALAVTCPVGGRLIVHQAPIYPTTEVSIRDRGLTIVPVDFNDLKDFSCALHYKGLADAALVQHSRQLISDRYRLQDVISALKKADPEMPVVVDDNYAVMKAPSIGVQLGADLSTFSLFKLFGPPGIGCVLGKADLIKKIRMRLYSGGSQVQGPEAMEALRSLVYAPVMFAIEGQVVQELVARLNGGEVPGVVKAYEANAQSRVALVELEKPIAARVIEEAAKRGAAPYPVGAESRYEVTAMVYRPSGTILKNNPELKDFLLRINPMRAGADTVIRLLAESIRASLSA